MCIRDSPYTDRPQTVILAKELLGSYFTKKMEGTYEIMEGSWKGPELEGIRYEQLIPWVKPEGDAFRVIVGDYVTTSDGTGIVHIAPTFGADDDRVAKAAGIPPLFMVDRAGKNQPIDVYKRQLTDCPWNWASRRSSASPRKTSARRSPSRSTTARAARR